MYPEGIRCEENVAAANDDDYNVITRAFRVMLYIHAYIRGEFGFSDIFFFFPATCVTPPFVAHPYRRSLPCDAGVLRDRAGIGFWAENPAHWCQKYRVPSRVRPHDFRRTFVLPRRETTNVFTRGFSLRFGVFFRVDDSTPL